MKIVAVTCESVINPISITCRNPEFSWQIESDQLNVFQDKWRIIVEHENGTIMWDSGAQEDSNTIGIPYAGKPLESCTRYQYSLSVWNTMGEEASSNGHYFETAFFHNSEWKARWIEPEALPQLAENPLVHAQNEWQEILVKIMRGEQQELRLESDILEALPLEPYDPAVRIRKVFACSNEITKARLYITAHGIYDIRINGNPVTETLLNPGFTSYDKRLKYQVYEVDSLLEAENAIVVTIADGWYKGKIAIGRGCEYGEVLGLLLQMEIGFQNGDKQTICSDGTWSWSYDGPVRLADLFLGEVYDATMDDGDPSLYSYNASGWKPVIVKLAPDEKLEAQLHPQVRVFKELGAQRVWTAPNGDTLVDFGQNLAGILRVSIRGRKGDVYTFEHGETLDKDGNYYYVFADNNKAQRDTYICKGSDVEVFSPKFTYHGFRYVRVKGGGKWTKEQFTALAISSDNPITGSFTCSDTRLNQLQRNIYWSQLSNNITIPTDCPTREKAGWTGDVVVYGATALFNQNMVAFYKDWLKSVRIEQRENGHVLGTVPQIKSYIQQAEAGSLGWGDVILTLPWQIYELFGDKNVLEENYEAMGKWLKAMEQAAYELPDGYDVLGSQTISPDNFAGSQVENYHYLINSGFHFGDWIIPSVLNAQGFSDGPASAFLTMNYVDTCLLVGISELFARISGILGHGENEMKYRKYAKRVRQAFEEEYVTSDKRLGQEMQGNYILALKHHMVSESTAIGFASRLNELIRGNCYRLDTGFMSTPHILGVLCDYGYLETAWEVLFQKECPSWLYEIDRGATTLWENWDAIRPDGQINNCSFNHYAFGCIGDFLYTRILGIRNNGVGYNKILLAPEYNCPLAFVAGTFQSVRGEIVFRWEKTERGILISGKIPTNTSALIRMPDGEMKELGNGTFSIIG